MGDRPDVVLHLQGGFRQLEVSFEHADDTLLLIRDPQERWHFNDNGQGQNLLVVLTNPASGAYVILIGVVGASHVTPPGELSFNYSESGFAAPPESH